MKSLMSHFETLELPVTASFQEVKSAYYRLMKIWHPDRFTNDSNKLQEAEEKVKVINHAYHTLKQHIQTESGYQSSPDPQGSYAGVKITPKDPADLYQEAILYVNQKNYQEAVNSLSLAIRINPNFAEAYRYRGFLYSIMGYELQAESNLAKAKELELISSSQQHQTYGKSASASTQVNYHSTEGNEFAHTQQNQHVGRETSPFSELKSYKYTKLEGHQAPVTSLALHRNILFSGSQDGQLLLWNLKSRKLFCSLSNSSCPISTIAVSPDGNFLASGDEEGAICLWHVPSSSLLRCFKSKDGAIRSIVFNSEQGALISGTQKGIVTLWNLSNGKCIQRLSSSVVSFESIQYAKRHNQIIAASSDGILRTWYNAKPYTFNRHTIQEKALNVALLTPDGHSLILAGDDDQIRFWSLVMEQIESTITTDQRKIQSLAVSDNLFLVASGSEDGSVYLWDLKTGKLKDKLLGHQNTVTASVFHNHTLITASLDQSIYVWIPNE